MSPATRALVLLDSIAAIEPSAAGAVVVSGSHGGPSSTRYAMALERLPHAVFFNDAGVGKDGAGVVALGLLESVEVACAVYGHMSARIGEAADGLASGVITAVNAPAARLGLAVGMPVRQACALLGATEG